MFQQATITSRTEIPSPLLVSSPYLPSSSPPLLLSSSSLTLLFFLLQVPTLQSKRVLWWWWPSGAVSAARGRGRFWTGRNCRCCWASRRRPTPSWGSFVPTWPSWCPPACSEPTGTPPPTCTCCSTPGVQVRILYCVDRKLYWNILWPPESVSLQPTLCTLLMTPRGTSTSRTTLVWSIRVQLELCRTATGRTDRYTQILENKHTHQNKSQRMKLKLTYYLPAVWARHLGRLHLHPGCISDANLWQRQHHQTDPERIRHGEKNSHMTLWFLRQEHFIQKMWLIYLNTGRY